MTRAPAAAFRVYDEDEFFATPAEEWLREPGGRAARPRPRLLVGGALLAVATFAVAGALALERLSSSGRSAAGARMGVEGSRTRYLAARSGPAPIRTRPLGGAPVADDESPALRAPRSRTGAVAKGRVLAVGAQGDAVGSRRAAHAPWATTAARPAVAPAPSPAPAPVPAAAPIPAAARVAAGEGPVTGAHGGFPERAAGAGLTAQGRPVTSAASGADRRERPEFGFER